MKKLNITYLLLSIGYIAIAQQNIQIQEVKDTLLPKATRLEEVTILGTRGLPRTTTNTPVPIDIVNVNSLSQNVPQYTLGGLLNYVAPSFSSTPQTMGDGTDHIDPATLRGLGPDQTLVLVNGKRRYQTALVNVNGTVGRGSVGTDLNAIPVSAIQNIEILRDGASAQYGSDAIAGVININLNKNIGKTYASSSIGSNITQYEVMQYPFIGDYANGVLPKYDKKTAVDGLSYQFNVNHGFALSKKKPDDFINVGITYDNRAYTNRAGAYTNSSGLVPPGSTLTADEWLASVGKTRENYRFRVGQSAVQNLQTMVNSNININANTDFYFFGGYGIRWGNAGGFYRYPFASNNSFDLYPYGFLPEINSRIQDYSFAFGFKGKAGEWLYDVSNTIGGNQFQYIISNTANISAMGTGLPAATQTRFNAGGLAFLQNTTNVDFNRNFAILHNLNVAFGAEVRVDNYRQNPGEESSWANYQRYNKQGERDIYNGDTIHRILLANGSLGLPTGGSQVFSGFTPANAVNKSRVAFGAYGEAALDITEKLLIDAALRLEQYTDFGFNASGKLAIRYKVNKYFAIRASGSNGYRAPSLQQQYYSLTNTQFIGTTLTQILTAPSTSNVVQLLGGQPLKPELSYNGSLGITLDVKNLKFTLDGYYTYIQDRIILTRNFTGVANAPAGSIDKQIYDILISNNASSVAFFANGINTQTYGVDAVLSYHLPIAEKHTIDFDLSGTYSQTDIVGDVRTSPLLATKKHIYFDLTNINNMTKTFPRTKANFMLNYRYKNFSLFARESFVGPVTSVGSYGSAVGTVQYYYSQNIRSLFVTDLSLSYQVHKTTRLTIGVNNLFDIYPDKLEASKGKFLGVETNASSANYNKIVDVKNYQQMGSNLVPNNNSITNNNQFNYPRSTTQIGLNGRYIFARVEINF